MGILRRLIVLVLFTSICTLMASIPWKVTDNLAATHIARVFIVKRSKRRRTFSILLANINKKFSKFPQNNISVATPITTDDSTPNDVTDGYTEGHIDTKLSNKHCEHDSAKDSHLCNKKPVTGLDASVYDDNVITDILLDKIPVDILTNQNKRYEANSKDLELLDWVLTFISGIYIACVSFGEFSISLIDHLTKLSKRTEFLFHILYKITIILYYIFRSNIKYIISWHSGLHHSKKIIVSTIFYTLCMATSLRASFMLISTNYHVIFRCTTFASILFCQALIILHLKPVISFILFFFKNIFGVVWSILLIIRILKNMHAQIQLDNTYKSFKLEPNDIQTGHIKGKHTMKDKTTENLQINRDFIIRELSCLLEFWLLLTCIDMVPLVTSMRLFNFFSSHIILFSAIESIFHVYITNIISNKWINLSLGAFRHMIIKFFDFIICLITGKHLMINLGWHDILGSRCSINAPKEDILTMDRWRNSIIGYTIFAVQSCMSRTTVNKVKESTLWSIANFIIFHAPQVIFLILPRFIFNFYVYYMMILKPIIYTTITLETDPLGNFNAKIECLILSLFSFTARLIISNDYFAPSNIIPCLAVVISNKLISTMVLSLLKQKTL